MNIIILETASGYPSKETYNIIIAIFAISIFIYLFTRFLKKYPPRAVDGNTYYDNVSEEDTGVDGDLRTVAVNEAGTDQEDDEDYIQTLHEIEDQGFVRMYGERSEFSQIIQMGDKEIYVYGDWQLSHYYIDGKSTSLEHKYEDQMGLIENSLVVWREESIYIDGEMAYEGNYESFEYQGGVLYVSDGEKVFDPKSGKVYFTGAHDYMYLSPYNVLYINVNGRLFSKKL